MTATVTSLPDRIAAARARYTAEAIALAQQAIERNQK
jgi:hypothetical protein